MRITRRRKVWHTQTHSHSFKSIRGAEYSVLCIIYREPHNQFTKSRLHMLYSCLWCWCGCCCYYRPPIPFSCFKSILLTDKHFSQKPNFRDRLIHKSSGRVYCPWRHQKEKITKSNHNSLVKNRSRFLPSFFRKKRNDWIFDFFIDVTP